MNNREMETIEEEKNLDNTNSEKYEMAKSAGLTTIEADEQTKQEVEGNETTDPQSLRPDTGEESQPAENVEEVGAEEGGDEIIESNEEKEEVTRKTPMMIATKTQMTSEISW